MHRPTAVSGRVARTISAVTIAVGIALSGIGPATAVNVAQSQIVSPDPANWTPNIQDGQVNSIVQIGGEVYAAGQFTQVQAAGGGTIYSRSNIVAFDATTGAVNTTFAPTFDNTIKALAVAPDGNLFVGGFFNSVNGDTTVKKLVKLNSTTGQRITGFTANANGNVWDIKMYGNRLIVGGKFTSIKNVARDRLAAVDPTTGAVDPNVSFSITDPHTSDSIPWVYSIDVSPSGMLAIIGNFMKVNGQTRPQSALIDLSTAPASLVNWETDGYVPPCFSNAFDTYMRDVDFSPDGSYFVIAATGGPNVGTLCDTAAAWTTNARGTGLQPAWVDVTGGDTLSAVAVTGSVVYAGGHQRWMNNYYGTDSAGPGAVVRNGIAALDPTNGVPFSWNPGKDRGAGVFALYSTNAGLWMGSDTDHVAGETRKKIAFFPLAGGKTPPPTDPYTLPGDLYNAPSSACQSVDPSILYRVNAGGPSEDALDCGPNWLGDDSDSAAGAAYRNTGSNPVPSWGQQFSVNGTVPSTTPREIFDSERWDPSDPPEMQWSFAVPSGTHLQVRLYLINQYSGTSQVGQRVFDVAIDGTTVLNQYDIVADVGNLVGTMKAFNITSDGNVNIDFTHEVENPLINGIEIVNADVSPLPPPGAINNLTRRTFDGSTPGTPSNLNTPNVDWSTIRGVFALQGTLYMGSTDGTFSARTFDGSSVGPAQQINLNGLTDFPVQSLSGIFFSGGEIFYTVRGDPHMYHRYFTPESRIVGSFRFTVPPLSPDVDWSTVRGMTLANGKIYFARTDGNLYSIDFANGSPVGGTVTLVSPKSAGYDWTSNGLFVFTHVTPGNGFFSDDFSSGTFSTWTGVTRLTIDPSIGGVAPPSAKAQTSAQSAFAFKNLSNTLSNSCMSENVNVTSRDPSSTTLLRLRTAGNGPIAKVFVNANGILYVRSDAAGTQLFSGVALGTGWHSIELCGTVGTSTTWDLYRDGVKIVNGWTANTGTTPVGRVEIGNATAVTATVNSDDVVVDQTPG